MLYTINPMSEVNPYAENWFNELEKSVLPEAVKPELDLYEESQFYELSNVGIPLRSLYAIFQIGAVNASAAWKRLHSQDTNTVEPDGDANDNS
jgi:hypothetical protein